MYMNTFIWHSRRKTNNQHHPQSHWGN